MGQIKVEEMTKKIFVLFSLIIYGAVLLAAHNYQVKSPVKHDGLLMLLPSPISMQLDNGQIWGKEAKIAKVKKVSNNNIIESPFYQRKEVVDRYNGLILNCGKEFELEFRAYDEGMAYRFISKYEGTYKIINEQADFRFDRDYRSHLAYAPRGGADGNDRFNSSFEDCGESVDNDADTDCWK